MWGNLADKLGAKDLNSTLQKLGEAVAPPPGDSDDDEYDDEEEYDEDYEYDEEEYVEEEENEANRSGFGLVGMISRALDDRGKNNDEIEDNEAAADDEVDFTSEEAFSYTHRNPTQNNDATVEVEDWAKDDYDGGKGPISMLEQTPPQPAGELTPLWGGQEGDHGQAEQPMPHASSIPNKELGPTSLPEPQDIPNKSATTSSDQNEAHNADSENVETSSRRQADMPQTLEMLHSEPSTNVVSSQTPEVEPIEKTSDSQHLSQVRDTQQTQEDNVDPVPSEEEIVDLPSSTAVEVGTSATLGKDSQPPAQAESDPWATTVSTGPGPTVVGAKEVPSEARGAETASLDQATPDPALRQTQRGTGIHNSENHKGDAPSPTQQESSVVRPTLLPFAHDQEGSPLVEKESGLQTDEKLTDEIPATRAVEQKLVQAEDRIRLLEAQILADKKQNDTLVERMMVKFQEKEARLLHASSEENQHELINLEQRLQSQIQTLEKRLATDRNAFVKQQDQYRLLIEKSEARADKAESDLKATSKKQEAQIAQLSQREQRSVRNAEEKVAQTMALLDERNDEIAHLKNLVKEIESSMNEHAEGVEEAEQEVDELQSENDNLHQHVDKLEAECARLKEQVNDLEAEEEKLGHLQLELTMLKEERDRERAKSESMVQSTMSSRTQVETERDSALVEAQDLGQQLTAALADLEVVKADKDRILTANTNLQSALESFQDEREAEMNLMADQMKEMEESGNSAHAAAIEALRQAHADQMGHAQSAADSAIRVVKEEVHELQLNLEKTRTEKAQLRRSLDEAIQRLQTTQEDVVDRTVMKNILLDWCTMKDKEKRHQVLQLMANVLDFTESEREKVHLTHMDIESVRAKVVGALAAPLPPSKADVEHLEGDNVRDKWINFLMAETDDGS